MTHWIWRVGKTNFSYAVKYSLHVYVWLGSLNSGNCKNKLFQNITYNHVRRKRRQNVFLKCSLIALVSTPVRFLFKILMKRSLLRFELSYHYTVNPSISLAICKLFLTFLIQQIASLSDLFGLTLAKELLSCLPWNFMATIIIKIHQFYLFCP